MNQRKSGLDLSRFLAAVIVLMGHFLYGDVLLKAFSENRSFEVLHTGFQSVNYFFCLSGFILTAGSTRNINISWLRSRLIRLLPIYWVCWLVPLVVFSISNPSIPKDIGITGLFLSALASQSLSSEHYLSGPNSPLWSLSVEVWLSIFLIPVARLKSIKLHICVFLSIVTLNNFISSPIVNALPFFLLGVITADIIRTNEDKLKSKLLNFGALLILLFYWIIAPIFSLGFVDLRMINLFYGLICSTSTLIYFNNLLVPTKLSRLAINLGQRSYVLYACHAPILVGYSYLASNIFNVELTKVTAVPYLLIGLALVLIATEILYLKVDSWAIDKSRKNMKKDSEKN